MIYSLVSEAYHHDADISPSHGLPNVEPIAPPEIIYSILDVLSPPPTALYIPDEGERQRILTLTACTLVCRSWSKYVQRHLYAIVWITEEKVLSLLMTTLQSCSHLASLVKRVIVTPLDLRAIEKPADFYLATTPLFSRSPVESLVVSKYRWDGDKWPEHSLKRFGHSGNTIIHLQLSTVVFPSELHFFHTIRSFNRLVHLALVGVQFVNRLGEGTITDLQAQRPSWAAASLRVLEVGGVRGIPGIQLLGNAIETFRISSHVGNTSDDPILDGYRTCLSLYHNLKALRITLHPWASLTPPGNTNPPAESGAQIWRPIHDNIRDILGAVQSSDLRTVEISLVPQQQDVSVANNLEWREDIPDPGRNITSSWPPPVRYRYTRRGVLDTVFASDVKNILISPRFAKLAHLNVLVFDNPPPEGAIPVYNTGWWNGEVAARLPGLRPDVKIKTRLRCRGGSEYLALWQG